MQTLLNVGPCPVGSQPVSRVKQTGTASDVPRLFEIWPPTSPKGNRQLLAVTGCFGLGLALQGFRHGHQSKAFQTVMSLWVGACTARTVMAAIHSDHGILMLAASYSDTPRTSALLSESGSSLAMSGSSYPAPSLR